MENDYCMGINGIGLGFTIERPVIAVVVTSNICISIYINTVPISILRPGG